MVPIWVSDPIGLASPAANGLDAGDHGGGHGAQADHHHSQFARCGRNLVLLPSVRICSSVPIAFS
jgi:hypothetical protein